VYSDDGTTYAYENGQMELTHLRWSEKESKLSSGERSDLQTVEVIGK
jgi:hypothetical protein